MARHFTGSEVITYRLADFADDAKLRALLQENAMQGWVAMSMMREPSFFAGLDYFGKDWAVIAEEGMETVGMYQCSEQMLFVNGQATSVGYLGGLRVKPEYRGRLPVLKRGYESVTQLSRNQNIKYWYTSIASDNQAALRVLEANLKGMPKYHFLGELATLAVAVSRQKSLNLWQLAHPEEMMSICDFYHTQVNQYQLAPVLSPALLAKINIPFYVYRKNGEIQAVMGLWNQQAFKQVVAQRYASPLNLLRPFYNAFAHLTKRVPLPAKNQVLDQVFLSFFALKDQSLLVDLIRDALCHCSSKVMTFSVDAKLLRLPEIKKVFAPEIYQTRLYEVCFDGINHEWCRTLIRAEAAIL